jgi:hypothetical protein
MYNQDESDDTKRLIAFTEFMLLHDPDYQEQVTQPPHPTAKCGDFVTENTETTSNTPQQEGYEHRQND